MADIEELGGSAPRRRFTGRKAAAVGDTALEPAVQASAAQKTASQIPPEIADDPELARAVQVLPSNYNFEIHKTIHRIRSGNYKRVGLQFPEGLLMYACPIADILRKFCGVDTVVLGDVTYGACCVDDYTAAALDVDFLVHYGHSCLIPIPQCAMPVLYVFVDIGIDVDHLAACIRLTFSPGTRLALACIIQFASALHAVKRAIADSFPDTLVPQARPLSPGEVLGCTAPRIVDRDALVFVGDGRFHLEAMMIANPELRAYRYDPYAKVLTEETYAHERMRSLRRAAIQSAASAQLFGVVLGTLGHQGSTRILEHVRQRLTARGRRYIVLLLSELSPAKLARMDRIEAWIQIACPRLSIDWGHQFSRPLLTPYEAEVALQAAEWTVPYPMDFYARDGGPWSVSGGAAPAAGAASAARLARGTRASAAAAASPAAVAPASPAEAQSATAAAAPSAECAASDDAACARCGGQGDRPSSS